MDQRTPGPRTPDCVMKDFPWALLPTLVLFLIAPAVGDAQVPPVTTSITSTTGAGDLGTLVAPPNNHVYDITGGTRPGGGPILFHSFGDFNVGPGDVANFLNKGSFDLSGTLLADGLATSNILARVTNPNPSSIFGTIQTNGEGGFDNANLFLMNPSGILFGPNATLNVGGSVSFTTAQYIRLFDGLNSANFYADTAFDGLANSVLAVAPVVDFGFLSPAAYGFLTAPAPDATITVHGSRLSVLEGQSISLVGGKVVIQGAQLQDGTVQPAQLSAPIGRILLATAASPGEFDVNTLQALPNVDEVGFTSYGSVSLEPESSIDVRGGNTVWIKGGQLVLSVNDATLNTSSDTAQADTISLGPGSFMETSNSGTDSGAELQLIASSVKMNRALFLTQTNGSGHGGDVHVMVDGLTLGNRSRISTGASSGGAGGDVIIQGISDETGSAAESVTLSGRSQIASSTLTSGAGGGIFITAESLGLAGLSALNSSTNGSGHNGDIVVSVQEVNVAGRATITSNTAFSGLAGVTGGIITIQGLHGEGSSAKSLILAGQGTGIFSDSSGAARLGDISVDATTVSLVEGAVIQAGTVRSAATAGNITIEADSVGISGGSSISSQAFSERAGNVTITADQLTLDQGSIDTNTGSPTFGHAGDVVLNVGNLSLLNRAGINSSATSTGQAGEISIVASGSVTMTSGSTITASSTGIGDAGQVVIATRTLNVDNGTITTNTDGPGQGGPITMEASNINLTTSTIATSSTGSGNAGDILINSKEIPGNNFEMWHSTMSTSAALADGGNIGIYATNMIRLTDSIITSSVGNETKLDTLGGNITIDPQFVILQNSQIRANAFAGTGGNIAIVSNVFLADPLSLVDASSQLGVSGTVNINAPVQNVSGELVVLSQDFSSAAALLAQQCAARVADGTFSTFVVAAREGLPVEPGGFLASPSFVTELGGSASLGQPPQIPHLTAEGLLQQYEARPLQLAKLGNACRR